MTYMGCELLTRRAWYETPEQQWFVLLGACKHLKHVVGVHHRVHVNL